MQEKNNYIVLTDISSFVGEALYKEYKTQNYKVIVLTKALDEEMENSDTVFLDWNPSSPLSSARAVREIMNITGLAPEFFIFIHTPGNLNHDFHSLQMTELENLIDVSVKGPASLVKEVLSKMNTKLIFIYDNESKENLSAIDTIIYGSRKSLTKAIVSTYRNTENPPYAIENIHGSSEEFFDFVQSKLNNADTKTHRAKLYTFTRVNRVFSSFSQKKQKR